MITSNTKKIETYAKSLGFDLIGFTGPQVARTYLKAYKKWLEEGHEATMSYMQKTTQRKNLTRIFPCAKSVIILGVNYYHKQSSLREGYGRIARYARGRDYHKVIKGFLKKLEKFMQDLSPSVQTKSYIDTGPILERALAEQAGLGFIGKNSCLITKEFGSWVFLAEIITNLELKLETKPALKSNNTRSSTTAQPHPGGACGTCTRCIDACPTKAIIAPGVIDARKCISYHTIENKEKIPDRISKKISQTKRIFGCDICQEVCPHNIARQKPIDPANATSTTLPLQQNRLHEALSNPIIASDQLSAKSIQSIKTDQQFLETFAGSPLMRTKRKGLQRNASLLID